MGPFVIVHRAFHLLVHLLVCCGIRWCQWWDWLVLVAFVLVAFALVAFVLVAFALVAFVLVAFALAAFMLVAFVLLLSLQLIYRVALVSNQSLCTL